MEMLKTLKDKVMGTDEQNKAAAERMKNNPMEQKFQKMMGNAPKDEKEVKPVEKAKGGKVKRYAEGGLEGAASDSIKKGAMAGLEDAMSGPGKKGAMAGLGMKAGGKVSSASKRADGFAIRGKTRA